MAEYLRLIRRGQLQTPIHRFTHPDTGRRVTLIGAMHVGEPGYFAGLRAAIDDAAAAGAVVHCEGSSLLPCDDSDVTDAEQQILADMQRCRELEKRRITELGWVGQIDGLGYPPQWRIVDLNTVQIIRRVGVPVMRQQVRAKTRMFCWPDNDPKGIDRLRLRTTVALRVMASDRRAARGASRGPADAVLLGQRTTVALEGVLGTDRDAVLVWGAMHLPGLSAGLSECGLVRCGEPEWHTVAQLPSLGNAVWRLAIGGSRRDPGRAQ